MPHITANFVLETSTSTSTGPLALGGPVTGFQAFGDAPMAVGDTCYYSAWAIDGSGARTGAWEVGVGTYSAANELTRTVVLDSSSGGSAISFAAGTKMVSLGLLASKTAQFDPAGALPLPSLASEPAAPAAGSVVYTGGVAGMQIPHAKMSGLSAGAPLGLWRGARNVREVRSNASTSVSATGAATQSSGGRTVTMSASSLIQQVQGFEIASTATAGTGGYVYTSSAPVTGRVGFVAVAQFGVIAAQAGNRIYVGLQDTSFNNDTNVDWLSAASSFGRFGIAVNDNTGNWQINRRLGAAVDNIDLGSGFAFAANDHIEMVLARSPGGSTIDYRIRKRTAIDGGIQAEASGSLSTNIFAVDTQLYMGARLSNGASAAIAALRVPLLYMESEF